MQSVVEVFSTSVDNAADAAYIIRSLERLLHPPSRISFDLEDCDKVLRVEAPVIPADVVARLLRSNGFACAALD